MAGALACTLSAPAVAQSIRGLTIGLSSRSLGTAGPRVAKAMGLFAKRDLNPQFVVMDSANATAAALISGSLKFAIAGPTELIAAQTRGQNIVAIATTYSGQVASLVLAKPVVENLRVTPAAPVAARLKALDGLLVGSPSATSIVSAALKGATRAVGATLRLTYLAQPAMVAALESAAIQGFMASAPFWALSVAKDAGVLWVSGPKGEFPPEFNPSSSGQLQTMRAFAEANADLVQGIVAVMADLAEAIDARPDAVKAVVAKLYPELDAATLDLLFTSESLGWKASPPTAQAMAHDIAFMQSNGVALPSAEKLNPAAMVFP